MRVTACRRLYLASRYLGGGGEMTPAYGYFHKNRGLAWDYRLGLRGAGLIAYGTLPASLGALGAFKPPDQTKLALGGSEGLVLIAVVAAVPVVLTFMLVRERLANWYILSDWLWLRSAIVTLGIIIASTAVCIATGLLSGHYHFIGWQAWLARPFPAMIKPFVDSLLLSFAYLVGSSTLFLTVVKEDSSLPLLPKKPEIEKIAGLRGDLHAILNEELLKRKPPTDEAAREQAAALIQKITSTSTALQEMSLQDTSFGLDKFYNALVDELRALQDAVTEVGRSRVLWDNYWAPPRTGLSTAQLERRRKINELQGISLRA